mmetsp:Transcript_1957/g.4380  ORF Transcript_1957/g.4380 Transcript_1957/m.4380 type:complete len:304 (+) Transcript_1957:1231-2142(+)
MHREDLGAALDVGLVDDDLAIEPAWPQEGGVEHVGPVGAREDDHAGGGGEAVHLDEQLVERVLALVVAAVEAALAARAPDRVDLVDEDEAGSVCPRLGEEVAHAGGPHADKHLDEIGAGDGVEWRLRLAGGRPGEERLPTARGANQQRSLGDLGAQPAVALGVLHDVDKLHDLGLRLPQARHVLELRLDLGRLDRLRLTHVEHALRPPPHLGAHAAGEEVEEADEQDGREEAGQLRRPRGLRRELDRHVITERDAERNLRRVKLVLKLLHRADGEVVHGRRAGPGVAAPSTFAHGGATAHPAI